MARHADTTIRIFIAGPSDVEADKNHAKSALLEFGRKFSSAFHLRVTTGADAVAAPGIAQEQIFKQAYCDPDIVIVLFWHRFGSPSGTCETGVPDPSGTAAEVARAYKDYATKKRPAVCVFQCRRPVDPSECEPEQLARVTAFFKECKTGGNHQVLYGQYKDEAELAFGVKGCVANSVKELFPDLLTPIGVDSPALSSRFKNTGFHYLFLLKDNDRRNAAKLRTVNESRQMFLLAHTGRSFLDSAYPLAKAVIKQLKGDSHANFSTVLLNPWSEGGLMAALGDPKNKDRRTRVLSRSCTRDELQKAIEQSSFLDKHRMSIAAYRRSIQEQECSGLRDRFRVVLSPFPIPATMFVADERGYYEPYLNVGLADSLPSALDTFECSVDKAASLWTYMREYFHFVEGAALSLDGYLTQAAQIRDAFLTRWPLSPRG